MRPINCNILIGVALIDPSHPDIATLQTPHPDRNWSVDQRLKETSPIS